MINGRDGIMVQRNPNLVWAEIFVEELARCGLKDICIAPGSRSTPLTIAFYAHPDIHVHVHLDERSAGFFGLGIALAEGKPVALLCTSGTAGANFFPAIIEANMSQVPLLILTADRPPELRHSGANQTIDQVKMFGDHVLWAVDAALPEQNPPDIAMRNLRTLAARAMATADGLRKGPVHLNFPFRKPLEPENSVDWQEMNPALQKGTRPGAQPFINIERGKISPSGAQVNFLTELISENPRGMIVCGPQSPGGDFPEVVSRLTRQIGYPLFADPLSGVRFGPHIHQAPIVGGYETFLSAPLNLPQPELVLYFGAVPTSKRLNQYLAGCDSAIHIHVRENGVWADENHVTSHYFQVDPYTLCLTLEGQLDSQRISAWLDMWQKLEVTCWAELNRAIDEMGFDGVYVAHLLDLVVDGSALLAGNSLPVRHVDQFGKPKEKRIQVFANRGASGIDGNLSTGLGIARHNLKPTTILTGDITFYHDSNGLLALRNFPAKDITFVVLNNNGGGIFQRLPIAQFNPPFNDLFQTPHGLDISSIARTYNLSYYKVQNRKELQELFSGHQLGVKSRLIEIKTDPVQDNQNRKILEKIVGDNLTKMLSLVA
jgi:2-succinyl-5-enolpyruvyl-6-hydroxy-3-cyclohexene-1-carboxylate synthase